jgi:outer membrane biosynthesis protein TonB
MLGVMGVLKSFTDELRKVQAEREAQLLLEVLRRRLGDLTFGDLTALLISPLGKKLAALKVSESFVAAAPASAAAPVAEKTSSKKSSLAKAKAAKPPKAREPKATKPTKTVKAPKPTKAVKAPKPTKAVKATKTVQAPKAPKTTAVNKTTKAPASAKPATTLSSAAEHKVAAPAQASATGPRKGAAPSQESRIAYDQSIVAALREAGDWTAATELRAKVGGTGEQIWLGLRRLTAEGMITRIGERDATRYKLVG